MRYLYLSALLLAGCGSLTETSTSFPPPVPSPVSPGRQVLASLAPSIDALGSTQADLIYSKAALWSDARPDLTGTVAQATTASQAMGASTLYQVLAPLADDGQAVVTTFGVSSGNSTRDCLTALTSPQLQTGRNPAVEASLTPLLSTMPKFHALRLLAAAGIPPAQRQVFKSLRDGLARPLPGELVNKTLKLSDMRKYLDGTYDPQVFGFQAVNSDLQGLVTPAQIIEGLRLDYPGGFAGETQVAQLLYPQTTSFSLLIPYSAAFGGTQTGGYPFTGNGFTATVMASALPEWVLPSQGANLAPGSQLVEVLEQGERILRGTWTGAVWAGSLVQARRGPRERVQRAAHLRGIPVHVISREGRTGHIALTQPIPEATQVGRDEYRAQVPWSELEF